MKLSPQTKKEAGLRMFDGERFIHKGYIISYCEDRMHSPFVGTHIASGSVSGIRAFWSECHEWQPILEWWDDLSTDNKRLCWVSTQPPLGKRYARWIIGKDSEGFVALCGYTWPFATPVLPEDLGDLS